MAAKVVRLRPGADDVAARAGEVLAQTLTHLTPGRVPLAANTIRGYRRYAAAYATWLGEHAMDYPTAFLDVVGAEAAAEGWRRDLLGRRKLAVSTVRQALTAVVLYYSQAGLHIRPKLPRQPRRRTPKSLTAKQQRLLRDQVRRDRDNATTPAARRQAVMNEALVELMLSTGGRIAELAALDIDDIVLTSARTGQVRYYGKGGEVRKVPLEGTPLFAALRAWTQLRGDHTSSPSFWVGKRGTLGAKGLSDRIREIGAAAGITGLTPHMLRHTFATEHRLKGTDLKVIQQLLGHASLTTTEIYITAGVDEEEAAQARVFGDDD